MHVFALETDKQRPFMGKPGKQTGKIREGRGAGPKERRKDEKMRGVAKGVREHTAV